jgi:hypothetical protein
MGIADMEPASIRGYAGVAGAVISNMSGIPADRFRILVAQDTICKTSVVPGHLRETFRNVPAAFTGGFARIGMKQMATTLNLSVPQEFRKESPFLASFLVGVGFSPILNIPRMLQLGRVSGQKYPEIVKGLFTSAAGWKNYATNTAMFAPGEGLRMMMCFGTKDWLMPRIGGSADAMEVERTTGIIAYTAKMALMAGPTVAAVETTFALATETVSTIHAAMHSGGAGAQKQSFGEVLKKTITPAYTSRCWASLFVKNIAANTPLFWVMFAADFYVRVAENRVAGQ